MILSKRSKLVLPFEEAQIVAKLYLEGTPINKIRRILHRDGATITNTLNHYHIARRDKRVYQKHPRTGAFCYSENDTICWKCKRSCAKESEQCSWARSFRPVEGWVAEPTICDKSVGETSFNVRFCPQFLKDTRRGAVST